MAGGRRTQELLKANKLQDGTGGGDIITDTNLHNGTWFKIAAIEGSTVIATLAGNISGTAIALDVGAEIIGTFTGITLTSGSVIAYDTI